MKGKTKITVSVGSERRPLTVEAWPVDLAEFPNLYVHRLIDGGQATTRNYWTVTEASTGLAAYKSRIPETRAQAVAYATRSLQSIGVKKFKKAVRISDKINTSSAG